jgi:hypothetical protein
MNTNGNEGKRKQGWKRSKVSSSQACRHFSAVHQKEELVLKIDIFRFH